MGRFGLAKMKRTILLPTKDDRGAGNVKKTECRRIQLEPASPTQLRLKFTSGRVVRKIGA